MARFVKIGREKEWECYLNLAAIDSLSRIYQDPNCHTAPAVAVRNGQMIMPLVPPHPEEYLYYIQIRGGDRSRGNDNLSVTKEDYERVVKALDAVGEHLFEE